MIEKRSAFSIGNMLRGREECAMLVSCACRSERCMFCLEKTLYGELFYLLYIGKLLQLEILKIYPFFSSRFVNY